MTAFERIEPHVVFHDDSSALDAVLLRVRLRARRRLAWLSWQNRQHVGAENQAQEIASLINDGDDPSAEADWYAVQPELAPLNQQIAAVEAALDQDETSRLGVLRRVFALPPADIDVLHVCLAAALDPAFHRLYAYLHDDAGRAYPTLHLIARLCGHGRSLPLSASSPARRWRMITLQPTLEDGDQLSPLSLDPTIRDWLGGADELDPYLIGRARRVPLLPALPEWNVDGAAAFAARSLSDNPGTTVFIDVVAPPRAGRKTFAAVVASQLGMPLLAVDVDAVAPDEWDTVFVHAQRHAFLHRSALAWQGMTGAVHRWSEQIGHFPVQFLIREVGETVPTIRGAVSLRVDLPAPSSDTRWQLWRQYAPDIANTQPELLAALALRAAARPGDIAAVARRASAQADQDAPMAVLAAGLRDAQRDHLGDLAQPLECPFVWDDLVVAQPLRDALFDFVYEARDRASLWEMPEARRLFPQGRGLAAMFSGSPGTGKTMAAQVMAAELGLDLFRIDLSTVVSKYVGETAHNLQRILTRAVDMDAVLFFDEADALYARRTEIKDAHDRYANTDTNHLLQAIERYDGIVILATNRKGAIDPAFLRRLRYIMEFNKPDASQRMQMWTKLITGLAGGSTADALYPTLERLSVELELTGAQIKYAVLTAVFAARHDGGVLLPLHLMHGLDRELGKEGRALNERERARLA